MQYVYDNNSKNKCWYLSICNKSKCDSFCLRHYKMDYLVYLTTMEGKQKYPIELRPPSEDYKAFVKLRDIKNSIYSFVTQGKNLLIYSRYTGNGKTEWSKKLLLAWLDSIWKSSEMECRALFVSMPKFIAAMKENISKPNQYYQFVNENISNVDLVVWDELNYKDWTPFEQDYMLNIISQRLALGKSNIYTTNYDLNVIEKKLGTRLASRILGCSEKVEFKGRDQRSVT